jgi:NADH:ubiquinone oxidoreductase subunit 6 (subunit J)
VFRNPDVAKRPKAPFATTELRNDVLSGEHMAHLGGQLFSTNLLAVEVAGTLLLVALVGTVAIVGGIRTSKSEGAAHE